MPAFSLDDGDGALDDALAQVCPSTWPPAARVKKRHQSGSQSFKAGGKTAHTFSWPTLGGKSAKKLQAAVKRLERQTREAGPQAASARADDWGETSR